MKHTRFIFIYVKLDPESAVKNSSHENRITFEDYKNSSVPEYYEVEDNIYDNG